MWNHPGAFLSLLLASSTSTVDRPTVPRTDGASRHYCDVAIVGSGFAGLAAAIEAGTLLPPTSKIVVIEKMHKPGGNSLMNAGQLAVVGSPAQAAAGIHDSVELLMDDMCRAGVNLNHPHLLRTMIEHSPNLLAWTREELGVEYRDRVTQMGGHSVPRTLSTLHASGNDIIRPMLRKIKGMPNVQLLTDTAVETILVENTNEESPDNAMTPPRVQGLRVRPKEGPPRDWMCKRGVVLASGGFSADVAFRSIQNPSFDAHVDSTNQPGATAEVLKQALKLGATPVQLSRIQLGPWTSPDEHGFGKAPFFCLGAGFPYGILIDPVTSKRFVNELGNRYERSMAILRQLGHPAVCITDAEGAKHSLKPELDHLEPIVRPFDTIDELARHYDMDAAILKETVATFNQAVKTGHDEAFGKPIREDTTPIVTPPFYGVRLWPKVHHCMGGLQINEQAQVMHLDGHAIPGLYAAGEVTGGIHGGDRLGSCATLDCLFFGRTAGHQVATVSIEQKALLQA